MLVKSYDVSSLIHSMLDDNKKFIIDLKNCNGLRPSPKDELALNEEIDPKTYYKGDIKIKMYKLDKNRIYVWKVQEIDSVDVMESKLCTIQGENEKFDIDEFTKFVDSSCLEFCHFSFNGEKLPPFYDINKMTKLNVTDYYNGTKCVEIYKWTNGILVKIFYHKNIFDINYHITVMGNVSKANLQDIVFEKHFPMSDILENFLNPIYCEKFDKYFKNWLLETMSTLSSENRKSTIKELKRNELFVKRFGSNEYIFRISF